MEDRSEEARRLFERACELEPDNPVAGNSLAEALLEAGRDREALEEFDPVLGIDPGFANAHYGRSMVFLGREAVPEALAALRAMFAKCDLSDPRLGRMLEAARDTFLKLTNIVGNDRAEEAKSAAEELRQRAEEESGMPVEVIEEKLDGALHSSLRLAWDHGLDHHEVAMQSQLPTAMLIERQLAEVEALREAQFCDLTLRAHNAASAGLGEDRRSILPPSLLKRSDAHAVDSHAAVVGLHSSQSLPHGVSFDRCKQQSVFLARGVLPL